MIVTNLGMNLVLRQLTVVFSLRASVTLTIEDHPLIMYCDHTSCLQVGKECLQPLVLLLACPSHPSGIGQVGICSQVSFESGMTSKIMLALGLCRSQENCHIHSELSAFKFNCNVLQVAMTHILLSLSHPKLTFLGFCCETSVLQSLQYI